MNLPYQRLWTVDSSREVWQTRPAEVVWDAPDAKELLGLARHCGYVVRGPYVLEDPQEAE